MDLCHLSKLLLVTRIQSAQEKPLFRTMNVGRASPWEQVQTLQDHLETGWGGSLTSGLSSPAQNPLQVKE